MSRNSIQRVAFRLQNAEARLNLVLSWVVVLLICASASLAIGSVVMRYLWGTSYNIAEELCRFSVVYATMLYFGPLITRNSHLTMSLLTDTMTPRVFRWFDLVLYSFITLLLVWLLDAAWKWEQGLVSMGLTTMSGEMKAWIPSAALPSGLALALLYSILRVLYRIADIPLHSIREATK